MGVVVRRCIDFLILLIPTPLVSALFFQKHPYFLFIFLMFSFLFKYIFVIRGTPMVKIIYFLAIMQCPN